MIIVSGQVGPSGLSVQTDAPVPLLSDPEDVKWWISALLEAASVRNVRDSLLQILLKLRIVRKYHVKGKITANLIKFKKIKDKSQFRILLDQ
jgi:hypothetical protein